VRATPWSRVWLLAAALATLFFAVSLAPSIRPLFADASVSYALRATVAQDAIVAPLVMDVLWFALAGWLVHFVLAGSAIGLTKAFEVANPTARRNRLGICFLWFVALAVAIVLWSASRFPQTHAADYYGHIANAGVLGISVTDVWIGGTLLGVAGYLAAAARHFQMPVLRRWALASVSLVAVGFIATLSTDRPSHASTAAPTGRPNVIIIGIDSLRPDVAGKLMAAGRVPNLSALLAQSASFTDVTSPLARTYPAWLSILTGRSPTACGVVCNLMPREQVRLPPTLQGELRENGYQTILATDEVRFSNIDQSYGFDQVITPSIGSAEFLIGRIADLPVVNLIVNLRVSELLFPEVYANRAVSHVYDPDTFVRRVRAKVKFDRPTFLATHLTLPHFPYLSARSHAVEGPGDAWDIHYANYLHIVEEADRQLGQLLDWLRAGGALDNAIVVVLSDHGEALRRPGDSLLEGAADMERFSVPLSGHGSSVLSAAQFQVLLGFAGLGEAAQRVVPRALSTPAALEDVAPTILQMLGLSPLPRADGMSLAQIVAGGDASASMRDRVRFTETGFNTPRLLAGDLNPDWIAMQAAEYYRVNPQTAYLELRKSSIAVVESMKERAAIRGDELLVALPNVSAGQTYLLVKRQGGEGRIVRSLQDDPDIGPMWQAMRARFGAAVTPIPAEAKADGTDSS
jgi:arylsulfatase A-like enzyme